MEQVAGINIVCAKAGLTGISGAATTYSTGAAGFAFSVKGKAGTKAQVSGGTTPAVDGNTGDAITLTANKGVAVVWAVNASGTVFCFAGPVGDLDTNGAFEFAPQFPVVPSEYTPFAYTLHKAGSTLSGTFTFGSSNWNTTGMTHTVVDVLGLPDRPQTS